MHNICSPTPNLWKTSRHGKIYVFEEYWPELSNLIQTGNQPLLAKQFNVSRRTIRNWEEGRSVPKLYTKAEFSFTRSNLYWFGLFFADGHIRNNGSKYSFTYQVGSSNIFQGYWYTQLIQKFLPLFKHKPGTSLTSIDVKNRAFKTNLSAISPIFMKMLISKKFISKRKNEVTTGYSKYLPPENFGEIEAPEFFQGLFDGDGHISLTKKNGIILGLALDPLVDCTPIIDNFPLVPTLSIAPNRESTNYNGAPALDVRFAPASLVRLNSKYTALDVVKQLKFMLLAAENSIRPDKVHNLVKVVKRITSDEYGTYRHCNKIQKSIRELAIENGLNDLANSLVSRYPIKCSRYQPFRPRWAEDLCSKRYWLRKAWEPFLHLENLNLKSYPKKINIVEGVPVNFRL